MAEPHVRWWSWFGAIVTLGLVALPLMVDAGLIERRPLELMWNDDVAALDISLALAAVIAPLCAVAWAWRNVLMASILTLLALVATARLVAVVVGHAGSGDIGLALVVMLLDVIVASLALTFLLSVMGVLLWRLVRRGSPDPAS